MHVVPWQAAHMVVEVERDGHSNPRIEGEQVLHAVHVGLVIVLNGQAPAAVLAEPREVPAQGRLQQRLTKNDHCETCMWRVPIMPLDIPERQCFCLSWEAAVGARPFCSPC